VIWNFAAPPGAGDTHFSIMRGTKANVIIRQGREENYQPELYVEPVSSIDQNALARALQKAVEKLGAGYPGLGLQRDGNKWHIQIPPEQRTDHEAHFGQVMEKFLTYLKDGKLPPWEGPNTIAKYYTTVAALELARNSISNFAAE
jgi:hypothetical protein